MSNPQPSSFGFILGWVAVALLGFEVMTKCPKLIDSLQPFPAHRMHFDQHIYKILLAGLQIITLYIADYDCTITGPSMTYGAPCIQILVENDRLCANRQAVSSHTWSHNVEQVIQFTF